MLIKREGSIFDGLLKHIRHHSLALLLIELLQIQIKPETTKEVNGSARMAMYNSDGSDAENHDDDAENEGQVLSA